MSKQNKAPRWQDVPEEARGAVRQAMSLIRDDARYVDTLRLALDAALARLAEPAPPPEPARTPCPRCGKPLARRAVYHVCPHGVPCSSGACRACAERSGT